MNIFTYLKNKGIDTVDTSFYSQVKLWESWYKGNVRKFHHYHVYNGLNKIPCRRLSLGMAKKISEDIADVLLNEKVKITVSEVSQEGEETSSRTGDWIQQVLKDNHFLVKGNEYQEKKAYSGTVAYVVQVDGATIDSEGNLTGGVPKIKYVQAKNIYPISWENGTVTEVAFLFPKTIGRKKYVIVQMHRLRGEGDTQEYVITKDLVECTNGAGTEVPPAKWESLGLGNLVVSMRTRSDQPQFVIDRLNIVNNADEDDTNPMGVAIFANSIDTLAKIDLEYDSYANEFDLGRKRIFVAPEILENEHGDPIFDSNDTVFYQLPDGALAEGNKPIYEINMDIRTDAHSKAINDDLNFLSFKCGFGTERYRFDKGNVQTATQIISENSDMYRTIVKQEIILDDVIKALVMILIRVGMRLGVPGLTDQVEITVDFDDSIIEDTETERKRDREDVNMGAMTLLEYRMKWYSEDEATAKEHIIEEERPVME